MDPQAYIDLHRLEGDHWWYQGTRTVYQMLLDYHVPPPRRSHSHAPLSRGPVLDLGCGTGSNLELLSRQGRVVGLDLWHPALRTCPADTTALVQGTGEALPFADDSFGLVTVLGVLEHIVDDVMVLREARRVCRPEGSILVLTSAFMLLWSEHDRANRHVRRYTIREFRHKVAAAGLHVRYVSYQNFFLFPLAAMVRLAQRLRPSVKDPRIDIFPMPPRVNAWLTRLLTWEGRLMRRMSFPFGVSIVAVLTR